MEEKIMEEKIMEALETIKKVCMECTVCSQCPLSNARTLCMVKEKSPENWKIGRKMKIMLLE